MTITVACPSCSSSFPVDPAKIPSNGVRAQCSFCPEIFDIDAPVAVEEPGATPPVVETPSEDVDVGPSVDDIVIETNALPEAVAAPAEAETAASLVTDKPAPADEPETSPGPIRFGKRSPEDEAKSLARSLVSDLIAYNAEKHKEAVAAGTLQEIFGEEIVKSLKEYKEQVESDVVAKGTFFNDALNSILAEGQETFNLKE